jgi:hypothetical protein
MSRSQSADQGKIGRVVGFSLAGLWLAMSIMAAIADTTETENTAVAAIESSEISADVLATSN